ncbi:MAG: hypothetical protein KGL39_02630 [Patescibacteria group bacterium]|nr:hypothetical protein [Patescibacteria group bacterium]
MKTAKQTAQQGDVLFKQLPSMPAGEKKKIASKRIVVAHGESGHSHVIEDDEAELIETGGKILLSLSKPAVIRHEEHKPIKLDKGVWELGRVQEFDYFKMMQRQVID